jgi:MYXO-CTERM domain-containing protein
VKRFSIFAGTVGGLALAGTATAGLNGLSYDLVGEGLVAGTYTVRLYADVDAGDRLDAVYGNSDNSFMIGMLDGASTYQNATYGGPTSKSINSAFFAIVPSLEWDSYVTIGCLYSDGTPFGNNALQDIGIDWAGFEAGGDVSSDNGTWFVTPADAQGGEMGGRVLIAQFSIYSGSGDYDMAFSAGFQGKNADGVTWSDSADVMITGVPAPGALALLGLAGIAGRRRRRG